MVLYSGYYLELEFLLPRKAYLNLITELLLGGVGWRRVDLLLVCEMAGYQKKLTSLSKPHREWERRGKSISSLFPHAPAPAPIEVESLLDLG